MSSVPLAEDCKSSWRKLRDSYRKAMALRKTKSGQAAKKIRNWKYEDQMGFLSDHFQDRSTYSNISGSSSSHSSQKGSPPHDSPRIADDETDGDGRNVDDDLNDEDDSNDDDTQSQRESTSRRNPVVNAKTNGTAPKSKDSEMRKSSKTVKTPDVATALIDYLNNKPGKRQTEEKKEPEKKKKETNEPTKNGSEKVRSPLMNFFIAMAETVDAFPMKLQVEVKAKVFATVSEYESRMIELSNQDNKKRRYEQFEHQNLYDLPNLCRGGDTDTRLYPIVTGHGETSDPSTSTYYSM